MSEAGAIRELFAVFDISFNSEALDRGAAAVDTLAGKLAATVKAFAGFKVVQGIIGWGEHVAEAAREVEFGAIKAGMGIEEFQKLNQVAEKYGTTAEQLTISTRLFVRSLRDAGGTAADFHSHSKLAADAFHDLGINAAQFKGKSFAEILPVVADGFAKIGKGTRATADALVLFGHRGIGILPLMLKGGENLRKEMQAMQPVFEAATIEAADRATLSAKALGFSWHNLVYNIFGKPLMNALSSAADGLDMVVKSLKAMFDKSEAGKAGLLAITIALTAAGVAGVVAFWSWLWPLGLAVAALGALWLAIDDIMVWLEGGKSLTGSFLKRILGEDGEEKVKKFFDEDLPKWLAKVRDWVVNEVVPAFEKWRKWVGTIKDDFDDWGKRISAVVTWLEKLEAIYDRIAKNTLFGKFMSSLGEIAGKVSVGDVAEGAANALIGPGAVTVVKAAGVIIDAVGPSTPGPDASVAPASLVSTVPTNMSVDPGMSTVPHVNQVFNVSGGDPAEVQEAARRGAQEAINQTLRDTNASFGGAQ